jgi:hypothetical protein
MVATDLRLTPRPVASSVEELLVDATDRRPMDKHVDSLSGSPFERVTIDGEPYIVKHIGYQVDWLARALGDRECVALAAWRYGLLDALPPEIDHTVLGMSYDPASGDIALLMRDVGPWMIPSGNSIVPLDQHRRFLAHMARLHATFWGFSGGYGQLSPVVRYQVLHPDTGRREAAAGGTDPVPQLLVGGWAALHAAAPEAHDFALRLATDGKPLAAALDETPNTLVHGDWKFGNLGSHPDGRTILLDWGWPSRAGALVEIAWYLAVNCDRLPESKEDTIAAYRRELESTGIDTRDWWDQQLDLALLGGFVQLGWSKSGPELDWWVRRVTPVAHDLLR